MKTNKKLLGLTSLLLISPFITGATIYSYSPFTDEYVDFHTESITQLNNNPEDGSYRYSFDIQNDGAGYITDLSYEGIVHTYSIDEEDTNLPTREESVIAPGSKHRMIISYQPRDDESFQVNEIYSRALVKEAERASVSGDYTLSREGNSKIIKINCSIDIHEDKTYYDYQYVVDMKYNEVDYSFIVYPAGYKAILIDVEDNFNIDLATVTKVTMFEQVNIISYPRKENKGKTLAVVIAILGLAAAITLVTYEVIKFYKGKKKS